jgi:hypothetical protein
VKEADYDKYLRCPLFVAELSAMMGDIIFLNPVKTGNKPAGAVNPHGSCLVSDQVYRKDRHESVR